MTDDTNDPTSRTFMERLAHAFGGEPRDQADLMVLLQEAAERDVLDANTLQMIEGVFRVVDMRVRDIMIPRAQMVVVERDAELSELLPEIVQSGHSRFPVIGEDKDDVVGVLLAKDVLRVVSSGQTGGLGSSLGGGKNTKKFELEKIIRTAVFTPESKRLNVLLQEFRSKRDHMAIVFDEYGGVAGLVTIEDVLEQIVGQIDDEHDADEDQNIREHGEGRYTVRALTPIEEFNRTLGAKFSDEDFDTIGGLVMKDLGHMPKPGESISLQGFLFKILAADSRRIHLIQVSNEQVVSTL